MKKFILGAAVAAVFCLSAVAFTVDQNQMQEMMKKHGGPKADNRTELKLPDQMKLMQKSQMRQHMKTLSEITAALASNDLSKAADIAKTNLGWTDEEEARCSMVEKVTGEADFLRLGKSVHIKADELADAAKAGNRDKAIFALSELISNCNACHYKFKH